MKKFKNKKNIIRRKGVVKNCFANNKYEVIVNDKRCITYLCGNMLKYNIKVLPEDTVTVEFSKNCFDTGRIVYRD